MTASSDPGEPAEAAQHRRIASGLWFVVPSTGDTLDLAAANLFTALRGALGAVLLRPASPHQDDAAPAPTP